MAPKAQTEPLADAKGLADTPSLNSPQQDVIGYIDGVEGCRVSGWAWTKTFPDRALDVEIRLDGQALVTVRADRFRKDLAREGVGDGRHGFEAVLEQPAPAEKHRISAVARIPGPEGAVLPLVNRLVELRTVQAAAADPSRPVAVLNLRQWLDEFSEAQRGFEKTVRAAAVSIRNELGSRLATDQAEREQSARAIAHLQATCQDLEWHMSAFELFQSRFDGILSRFEEVLSEARGNTARRDRGLHVTVGAMTLLSAVSLALGLWSLLH